MTRREELTEEQIDKMYDLMANLSWKEKKAAGDKVANHIDAADHQLQDNSKDSLSQYYAHLLSYLETGEL